ncbi:hypothetical protein HNV11_06580 [Spirosoma taeanense]|uniref:Uncharacterized protein n=1 Tax=Spirosoma taeanense TaxID=2735870 RepID=A0A6M5Y3E1_9BACT|nr:hypothetical protein [Spirosoma taeanense]QJW89077.1 hypothetical protein HNV11_06580 [Spirosoma taeanense]
MIARFSIQKLSRTAFGLFCIGLTAILLGYQTVLLNDTTPSVTEKIMTWLTSRGILIIAIGHGYMVALRYDKLVGRPGWSALVQMALQLLLLITIGLGIYLITGDSTFFGLALAGLVLIGVWRLRGRWVALVIVVLLLNLPVQISRWYQANRNLPLPTSEQVNDYEQKQRQLRQQRANETRYWLARDYPKLAEYHAQVWPQRLLSDVQTGRWSSLVGMVLLGMILRRWRGLLAIVLRHSFIYIAGVCALTTLLELTSGRTYATTLRLYFDSLRYPGYYVFDVPDALYLTVSEAACLSTAMLFGMGIWLLSGWTVPEWMLTKRRAFVKRLSVLRLRSAA